MLQFPFVEVREEKKNLDFSEGSWFESAASYLSFVFKLSFYYLSLLLDLDFWC